MKPKEEAESKEMKAMGGLDRIIPKFCTNIQLNLLDNKNIVLSLFYNEEMNHALIERVVIDKEHAEKLADILLKAVKQEGEANEV